MPPVNENNIPEDNGNDFTNEQANAIAEATRGLSSTSLADQVLAGICEMCKESVVTTPINFLDKKQGLVPLFEQLSGINRIRIKKCEKKFETRPLVHSCVEIGPGRFKFMGKRTEATITYRSDLKPNQVNFAIIKECAHVLIRKAIVDASQTLLTNWPNMIEQQLDILDELFTNDLLRVELDDEPDNLTPQKRAIWHLERKATRLAMRTLVPKYTYRDFSLHHQELQEKESTEFVEEWLVRMNDSRLQLPANKFNHLAKGKYAFLDLV